MIYNQFPNQLSYKKSSFSMVGSHNNYNNVSHYHLEPRGRSSICIGEGPGRTEEGAKTAGLEMPCPHHDHVTMIVPVQLSTWVSLIKRIGMKF